MKLGLGENIAPRIFFCRSALPFVLMQLACVIVFLRLFSLADILVLVGSSWLVYFASNVWVEMNVFQSAQGLGIELVMALWSLYILCSLSQGEKQSRLFFLRFWYSMRRNKALYGQLIMEGVGRSLRIAETASIPIDTTDSEGTAGTQTNGRNRGTRGGLRAGVSTIPGIEDLRFVARVLTSTLMPHEAVMYHSHMMVDVVWLPF